MLKDQIKDLAKKYAPETIAIRQHLHANPELSYQEFKTSAYIQEKLTALGIPFEIMATTGVIGLIKGKNPDKKIIALRADMDALPIQEENKVDYVSTNKGISCLDIKKQKITNFTLKDNLQDLEFNTASCFKSASGQLYFGGINGFNRIDPEKVNDNSNLFMPVVTYVSVMNQNITTLPNFQIGKDIKLKYSQNFVKASKNIMFL